MAIDSTMAKVFALRRARLGDPPSADALADFRAGRLSNEERERVLEYASVDPETARHLLDAIRFPHLDPGDDEAELSAGELEQEWRRFRASLAEQGVDVAATTPSTPPRERTAARFWPLAASVVLAAGLGFLAADLRQPPVEPSPNPLILTLPPDGAASDRSAEAGSFAEGAETAVLRLLLEHAEPYASYDVVLRDAAGIAVWEKRVVPEKASELALAVPRSLLAPGRWRCELFGVTVDGGRVAVATYSLRIDAQGEHRSAGG